MGRNNRPSTKKTSHTAKPANESDTLPMDTHHLKEEIDIITRIYRANEEALLRATRGDLRSFILKDYGGANMEQLGGIEGIKALQRALGIKDDGYFGPLTFQALIAFQESHGLKTDAIAGPKTQEKLGISTIENQIMQSEGNNAV